LRAGKGEVARRPVAGPMRVLPIVLVLLLPALPVAAASSGDDASYPCVYYAESTFACLDTSSPGEVCVVGEIGGRPFGKCVTLRADGATASGAYPCVYVTEDVWVCYEAGCVEGMYGHYPIGYCLPPITAETAEPCLPGELACVERQGTRVCVTYRTGDLEDPRRACFGA
jgi:hypothetical protein